MAATPGYNLDISMDDASGTPADIEAYLDSAAIDLMRQVIATTTFGNTSEVNVPALRSGSLDLKGPFVVALDAIFFAAWNRDTSTSIVVKPIGPGTGNVSYSFEVVIEKYNIPAEVAGVVTCGCSGKFTGNVTRTVL